MSDGNRLGWTFDTALTVVFVGACGIVAWVKTARQGEAKAVDVALVTTKSALADTAASTDKQFESVRAEIKVLAAAIADSSKTVAEGFAGWTASLKIIAGIAAFTAIAVGAYSVIMGAG